MKPRLLSYDPVTKVRRLFHGASDGDTFTEERTQNIDGLLAENRSLRNIDRRYGDGLRVASIPIVVVEDLIRRGIWDDDGPRGRLMKWLNDPDNRYFLTKKGVI